MATSVLTPIPDAPTRLVDRPVPEPDSPSSVDDDLLTRHTGGHASSEMTDPDDQSTTFQDLDADATKLVASPTAGSAKPRRSEETGPLKVGEAFGPRYHVIRMLGIGGMGAVYQAWDEELGVSVAIKVIRPEAMADPEAAAEIERRFKRELLLARLVTHKNVVRIHDIGEVKGIKYITMPFVDGEDLATVAKKAGRLPIATIMHIARSVTSGLAAAHKADVVHRDLKPANIMVEADGEAMIMDFGIARSTGGAPKDSTQWQRMPSTVKRSMPAFADATTYGAVVGTVEYMAPEQAKGQAVDQRADIYAFGLILYDLLVGRRRAAHAVSAIAELQGRMEKAPPPPRSIEPEVPEALERIVMRCLEPDAAKRYQTTVELEEDLNRLDDAGKPIPIPPRFTARLIASAAALVLVLVGATWWLTRTPPPPKQHDPVSVLIADFENKTNDSTFDHTLEPMVRLALEGASFISAHDRTKIRSSFGVAAPEKLDEARAREFAVKQGVSVVLAGSIAPQGSGYEIAVKTIQTVTGKVIDTVTRRASSKDQVLEAATKLVATIRTALGDETSDSAQLLAMKSLSTTSVAVASEYAAAMDAQTNGKYEEAEQHLKNAVKLDPNFGLGYQGLASTSRNLGRQDEAEKYSKEALRHLDGMTEREQFAVRGLYYLSSADNQQCVKEYDELIARFPADAVAHNQRALCLSKLRNWREAVESMRQAVRILPKRVLFRGNLAVYADYAGDFETGEREAAAVDEPSDLTTMALAFAKVGQGRLDEARETYTKLRAISPRGASWSGAGMADLALYEGQFSEAARLFEETAAADLAAKTPSPARAARRYTSLAYARLLQGKKDAAIAAAEKALATSKAASVRFLAARVLVEAGAIDKARALSAALASELAAEPQAYGKIVEGEIALKAGDARQAVKVLLEANGVLDTWLGHYALGRAYLDAGAFPQADSEFDRCIARRGEALSVLLDEEPSFSFFPVVYYYKGRVREALHNSGFADSYREYLKIRGKSTEDPLLPEVRKRAGA